MAQSFNEACSNLAAAFDELGKVIVAELKKDYRRIKALAKKTRCK